MIAAPRRSPSRAADPAKVRSGLRITMPGRHAQTHPWSRSLQPGRGDQSAARGEIRALGNARPSLTRRATRSASRRPHDRTRHGAAALEAALVLPIVLTLLLACTDLARAVTIHLAVSTAARVGVERGATHRFDAATRAEWEASIIAAAREEAASFPNFSNDLLNIGIETVPEPGDNLRVVVLVEYRFRTVVSWPGLSETFVLRHQAGMRQYQ